MNSNTPTDDPFFSRSSDSTWNACIGSQGGEEYYVDGYMEAALALVNAVIEQDLQGQCDTLAMPILYNARHAVELTLKYVAGKLSESQAISAIPFAGHNIKKYWSALHDECIGDATLRSQIKNLKPFVDSLSAIDDDGQQLRYHQTLSGAPSLADKSICNLELVRRSLVELEKIFRALTRRTVQFCDELRTGTYTNVCSRLDLQRIAAATPKVGDWSKGGFREKRDALKAQFGLSGRQFAKALNVIKKHREMGGLLGIEFPLRYLSDDHALFAVSEWVKAHADLNRPDDVVEFSLAGMKGYFAAKDVACQAISETLSQSEIADLRTVYYTGSEERFCEYYDRFLKDSMAHCRNHEELARTLEHIIAKTNFGPGLALGCEILGRRPLATRIRDLLKKAEGGA